MNLAAKLFSMASLANAFGTVPIHSSVGSNSIGLGSNSIGLADMVYQNAKIYTVNSEQPWAEAMAIKDGEIMYVGDAEGAAKYKGTATKVVDAGGDFVSPGFTEGHSHPFLGAIMTQNEAAGAVPSGPEVAIWDALRQMKTDRPDSPYYFGMGFRVDTFGNEGPTMAMVDAIESEKPVFLSANTGHASVGNSAFFKQAGWDEHTPDPLKGLHFFQRNPDNTLTGYMRGAVFGVIGLDVLNAVTKDQLEGPLKRTVDIYASQGITTVLDTGAGAPFEDMLYDLTTNWTKADAMPFRLGVSHWVQLPEENEFGLGDSVTAYAVMDKLRAKYGEDNRDRLRLDTIKYHNDGVIEVRNAAMGKDYTDTGTKGTTMMTPEQTFQTFLKAANSSYPYQIASHQVGDGGITTLLDAVAKARPLGFDNKLVIHHAQIVKPSDIPRLVEFGIGVETTPLWFNEGRRDNLVAFGEERYWEQFPVKDLIDAGVVVGSGADFPPGMANIAHQYPPLHIMMAATRSTPPELRKVLGVELTKVVAPDQKLTLEQAWKMATLDATWVAGFDDIAGSLEAGKKADFIRMSGNPFSVPLEDVWKLGIKETWMDGKLRYQGDGTSNTAIKTVPEMPQTYTPRSKNSN